MQYDPAIAGTALASGLNVQYDLTEADVIVSLDADFLSGASYPGFHKLVRDYAERRKIAGEAEPALRGRVHTDDDRHEGRASAGIAGERDSGVCGGVGEGGGRCGR